MFEVLGAAGLLVVAKEEYSLMHLSSQFKARSVQRTYQSITLGCPSPASGQIATNIGRDSSDRKKMAAFTVGASRQVSYRASALSGTSSLPLLTTTEVDMGLNPEQKVYTMLRHLLPFSRRSQCLLSQPCASSK